jgi:hypothetical protein
VCACAVCDQVKETGDHGVFNSWGRNQYITTERTGKPSIVPAENRFSQNFIISNYSSIFPFDHDDGAENAFFFERPLKRSFCQDKLRTKMSEPQTQRLLLSLGSAYYHDDSNFLIYAPAKNLFGHSKRYTNNVFAYADVQKSYGQWSAYNSQATAWYDSGWGEEFINNSVTLLHGIAYTYQGSYASEDQPQALCDPSDPLKVQSITGGVPDSDEKLPVHPWVRSSGNRWHAPNASLQAVVCNTTIWDLKQLQEKTQMEVGSTLSALQPVDTIIAEGRSVLGMAAEMAGAASAVRQAVKSDDTSDLDAPIVLFQKGSDHWAMASATSFGEARAADYTPEPTDNCPAVAGMLNCNGRIITNATVAPGGQAVALELWFNANLSDHWTLASETSRAAAKALNYTLVRTEGWVYPQPTGAAQTALWTYFKPNKWVTTGETDNYLIASGTDQEGVANSAQYARSDHVEGYVIGVPPSPPPGWAVWPSKVPSGSGGGASPFEQSTEITGFEYFKGPGANVVPGGNADTWYPSWSSGGELFTSWTDGTVIDSGTNETVYSLSNGAMLPGPLPLRKGGNGSSVTQGQARLVSARGGFRPSGNPGFNLTAPCCNGISCRPVGTSPAQSGPCPVALVDVKTFHCSALPYQGRYPSGSLFFKGIWYYGTYAIAEDTGNKQYPCGNWCVLGPFVGFRHSLDKGATWHEPRMQMAYDFDSYKPADNLFGELGPVCNGFINQSSAQYRPGSGDGGFTCVGRWRGKVKMGTPHIVDLGQELEHSSAADPDGIKRAYMVGHGADQEYQPQSWMHGSQVYLARTKEEVAPAVMHDGASWEFFGGYKHGTTDVPNWVAVVDDAKPLFTWENRTGTVTMTYVAGMRKFIMVVSTPDLSDGIGSMAGAFCTYFLEADKITGPFRMISYLEGFGPQAYFVNIPSAFIEANASDGRGYLSYSANYAYHQGFNPLNSDYRWDLLPMRFQLNTSDDARPV